MAFSGVPVAVEGGGAGIAGKLFRQMVADFVRGTEGVMRDTDLLLKPRPAPTNEILMGEGGAVALNRALGAAANREAYYDYNDSDEPILIRGTGSGGGRTDLIVVRVEDPYAAGSKYQKPVDGSVGPYIFPRVIENVDSRVYRPQQIAEWAGESAITLGRVVQPANNTVITKPMIQDLRYIANGPQRYQEPDPPANPPLPIVDENPWTESRIQQSSHELSSTSWGNWPSDAGWRVPVPVWANGVDMFAVVENPKQRLSDCTGESRMTMGNWTGYASPFDLPAISADRNNRLPVFYSTTFRWGRSDGIAGSLQTFRFQARRTGSSIGRMTADPGTVIYICLNFKTLPIIN